MAKLSTATHELYLTVNNTGGVPSTIVGVLVSAPNGTLVSKSIVNPQSHFLSQKGDLNVTLPLTLGVGVSTSRMSGCSSTGQIGCNIGISTPFSNYKSGTVVVSLVTSLGNTFSQEYPTPSLLTLKNVFVISPTNVNLNSVDESLINESLLSQSGVVDCYGCVTNQVAGGNIFVVLLTASPSPVENGGTITVIATVYNYSPYPATGVTVSLSTLYTGTATVAPDGSSLPVTCGSPQSLVAEGNAAFTCNFTANSGGGTGTVTFVGSAEGCVVTGSTTTCTNGALVSSGVSSSNPVQIGTNLAFGLWQLDYYYFTYQAVQQQAQAPASIVPHGDTYVAFNLKVTNIYNTSMTILDNSYLQFVSPGSDVNEFIVQSVSYAGSSRTITSYSCTDAPPGGPSGSPCYTVAPGATVSLVFAAASLGSSSWEWGTTSPIGSSSDGCVINIIIAYALQSHGSYALHSVEIPFQSVYIQ